MRIPSEVSEEQTLHYEHFEFWCRHNMALWLHRKLRFPLQTYHLQFQTWLEKTICAYLWVKWQTLQMFCWTTSCCIMLVWLCKVIFFPLYFGPVYEMHANTFPLHWISSLCRWEGHQSHDPPAAVACWLPADFSQNAEHWLWDCRIAISVSKNTVVLFVQTAGHIWELQLVQVFGQLVNWVYKAHYLGGESWCTADMFGTYKSGREEAVQRLDMLDPHLNRRTLSFLKNVLLYEQLMHPLMNNV